jgi:pimeloyl-ACP methyl ester carboxylesterase
MSDLGYERYIVSAGDVGCDVAEVLAAENPAQVAALHLTDVSQLHYLVDPPADLSDAEKEYVRHGQHWQATEGAYSHEQATKPQTLAVGLGDSPAGLAAWILEKLHGWTDCDGDVESVFSRDELLTWISAYWFDGSIGTSFSPYAGGAVKSWPRLVTPTAFTIFPKDLVNAPKEFADRFFNVKSWQEFDRGGHFAAWEDDSDAPNARRAFAYRIRTCCLPAPDPQSRSSGRQSRSCRILTFTGRAFEASLSSVQLLGSGSQKSLFVSKHKLTRCP